MYFQKYEISELTTSIIRTKLQKDKSQNIFELNTNTTVFLENSDLNLDNQSCFCNEVLYLRPDFALTSALQILNGRKRKICCQYKISNSGNSEDPFIQIVDNSLNIAYTLTHNDRKIPFAFLITKIIFNKDLTEKPKSDVLKHFIKSYLDTNEFILIQDTNNPNGFKFLIKDLGNNFLIYRFMDEISDPNFIYVALYKKQKYFNDILN